MKNEIITIETVNIDEHISTMRNMIETIGKTSKELCCEMYNTFKTLPTNESKLATKTIMDELKLSKSSISQMKKAGEMFHLYPTLADMSHTKIVELAPINETDYTMDEFAFFVSGKYNADLMVIDELTQKEIRVKVNEFINDDYGDEETDGTGDEETDGTGNEETDGTGNEETEEIETSLVNETIANLHEIVSRETFNKNELKAIEKVISILTTKSMTK